MVVDGLTRAGCYYGIPLDTWLPTRQAGAPRGVVSRSMIQGWNDANVATFLFNGQRNDSYVAAFLMNLRS